MQHGAEQPDIVPEGRQLLLQHRDLQRRGLRSCCFYDWRIVAGRSGENLINPIHGVLLCRRVAADDALFERIAHWRVLNEQSLVGVCREATILVGVLHEVVAYQLRSSVRAEAKQQIYDDHRDVRGGDGERDDRDDPNNLHPQQLPGLTPSAEGKAHDAVLAVWRCKQWHHEHAQRPWWPMRSYCTHHVIKLKAVEEALAAVCQQCCQDAYRQRQQGRHHEATTATAYHACDCHGGKLGDLNDCGLAAECSHHEGCQRSGCCHQESCHARPCCQQVLVVCR
mmetsp:Transcript_14696/g.34377  ORF Transcript_14696/g.34377 Transcript_14696/m.34377 type:complete len:281 (+) Transcript_14696:361-1203(+)